MTLQQLHFFVCLIIHDDMLLFLKNGKDEEFYLLGFASTVNCACDLLGLSFSSSEDHVSSNEF